MPSYVRAGIRKCARFRTLSRRQLPRGGRRGDDRLPAGRIPGRAPQEDPHEQYDRTAQQGDPTPHPRRGRLPRRQRRPRAHLREDQVRHLERMEHPTLPRHVPAR